MVLMSLHRQGLCILGDGIGTVNWGMGLTSQVAGELDSLKRLLLRMSML